MIDRKIKEAVAAGAALLTGGTLRRKFLRTHGSRGRHSHHGRISATSSSAQWPPSAARTTPTTLSPSRIIPVYGLSSAVLTNDLQLAMRFALELEAGMVHLNGPTVHDEPTVPFGGVKDSGSGREGGRWSVEEMTEVKWVTIQMGRRHYPF